MVLADTLSRAYLPKVEGQEDLEFVNAPTFLAMLHERIREIQQNTSLDPSLQLLKNVIQNGWPEDKSELPAQVLPYYKIHDELGISDGLIFRGERLVIPRNMRRKIKNDLHVGHGGVSGCLCRAREYVYWPGMSSEIKEFILSCDTCQSQCTTK